MKIRASRFHTLNPVPRSVYYSIITHAHTFHGDVNARRYFSENGTISSEEREGARATRGQINGKRNGGERHSVVRDSAPDGEVEVCIPAGSEIPKGSFPPPLPPPAPAPSPAPPRADGDCKRTRWSEMAPLTSDAPNAIRTTLSLSPETFRKSELNV